MSSSGISAEQAYTRGEEIANTLSAAAGLVVFAVVSPFLMGAALASDESWAIAGCAIFLVSVFALTPAPPSTMRSRPAGRRSLFASSTTRRFSFSSPGPYTPFALGPLAANAGLTLALIEWAMALLGIAFKWAGGLRYRAEGRI